MKDALQGRKALITGGSRGIGLAIVEALAAQGAEVVFTARRADGVAGAMAALPSGLRVRGVVCDVTDRAGMAALLAEPVDILVNNAGVIQPIGRLAEVDIQDWAENLRINVVAAVSVIQLALPGLLARRGTVINLSSGAAHRPMEGWSAYCAGKAALAMVTRCLHLEHGDQGLRAFGFAPGLIDTDMQGEIRQSGINPVSALPRTALRTAAEPGRAIAWLCTPDADDLVGQELDIRTPEIRSRSGLEPLT
jgi:NAD(P)-dependent dehydrogenase (short-subunit alcohol dehydrogenase family)